MGRRGTPYYVEAVPPVDVNKSTEWFIYPGVWTTYILLLFFAWLLVLSVSSCSPGAAWTVVNLAHFAKSCVGQLLGRDMDVVVPTRLFTRCMLRVVRLNPPQRSAKSR